MRLTKDKTIDAILRPIFKDVCSKAYSFNIHAINFSSFNLKAICRMRFNASIRFKKNIWN